jgi:predicted DNA-binding transcriptional regulator AlpA
MPERKLPRLMSLSDIIDRLGYSRTYTTSLVNSKGFPDAAYELGGRRVWLAEDVEAWVRKNRPQLEEDTEA